MSTRRVRMWQAVAPGGSESDGSTTDLASFPCDRLPHAASRPPGRPRTGATPAENTRHAVSTWLSRPWKEKGSLPERVILSPYLHSSRSIATPSGSTRSLEWLGRAAIRSALRRCEPQAPGIGEHLDVKRPAVGRHLANTLSAAVPVKDLAVAPRVLDARQRQQLDDAVEDSADQVAEQRLANPACLATFAEPSRRRRRAPR